MLTYQVQTVVAELGAAHAQREALELQLAEAEAGKVAKVAALASHLHAAKTECDNLAANMEARLAELEARQVDRLSQVRTMVHLMQDFAEGEILFIHGGVLHRRREIK
jgi:hypothetical protein